MVPEKYKSDDDTILADRNSTKKQRELYQGKEFYTDFETFIGVWNNGHRIFGDLNTVTSIESKRKKVLN